MAKLTYSDMLAGLYDLSRDELHELNKNLIIIARSKSREIRAEKAAVVIEQAKFQLGDVIRFIKAGRGRHSGVNYFKFENLNRNRDCMQGRTCDVNGVVQEFGAKWTVPLSQPTCQVHMRAGQKV